MAKERKLSAFDRAVAQAVGDQRELGSVDDPARGQWPELWRWLATVHVGRDSLKNPAYLTVRLGPEGAAASLVDRDLGVSVDVACAQLSDVFSALEMALTGPSPPVRSWGKKEPHLRKRRGGS